MFSASQDRSQFRSSIGGAFPALEEYLGVTENTVERRPKLVAHVCQECGFRPIITSYRVCLARLSIVVSAESAKNWVSKFSIASKDDACVTNEQKESDELDHLEEHLLELVRTAPFDPKNRGRSTPENTRSPVAGL